MADELASAIERLRTSTERLNTITDAAANHIKHVEMFLEEAGVGVSAWTLVKRLDGDESMYLEYRRLPPGKFRIAVVFSSVTETGFPTDNTVRAWSECSREEKLASFGKLPALLLELGKIIDEQTGEAEKALATLSSKLPLLKKKRGE